MKLLLEQTLHNHIPIYLRYNPFLWRRYLGDIYCIWADSIEINESFKYLNCFRPAIKSTMDHFSDRIKFLDVLVMKKDQQLKADFYLSKMVDINIFTKHQSCHRHISKRSIPFGQAIRLKRIISNKDALIQRLNDLEIWLAACWLVELL